MRAVQLFFNPFGDSLAVRNAQKNMNYVRSTPGQVVEYENAVNLVLQGWC